MCFARRLTAQPFRATCAARSSNSRTERPRCALLRGPGKPGSPRPAAATIFAMSAIPGRPLCAVAMAAALAAGLHASGSADRAVYWTIAAEGGLERELNTYAARGLRVAATSDGLPCGVTVMQAPEQAGAPAA